MKWMLNLTYLTLLILLSPVIIYRSVRHGRYRKGWKEKLFGLLPTFSPGESVVWFHAVSVGEVLQLQTLIAEFKQQVPAKVQVLITTSTDSGFEVASSRFPDCCVSWFPLDFSWAISNAIRRVRPNMLVLVELELWPNLLKSCEQNNIRTAIINARMSDRSFAGYSRIRRLVSPLLQQLSIVAAQNEQYADRLLGLGVRPDVMTVTGSIKFDGVCSDRNNPATQQLANLLGIEPHHTVFIAGSTQHPEEKLALSVWKSLRKLNPELRLILVPRHKERFDDVAKLVTDSGCTLSRRAQPREDTRHDSESVILLDTIGELNACWGLADIAFVGGSFGTRGGQNMLEPAAYGAAVIVGPNTSNFREIVQQLSQANGIIKLARESELQTQVSELLQRPLRRWQLGQAAQTTVINQQGAVDRTIRLLVSALAENTQPQHAEAVRSAA
ncbi:MAG: 3-deoxy-D-manno-octulosonic acid transferase [Fuerstiella sp.]